MAEQTIEELESVRIDQLPPGIPEPDDLVPYRSMRDGITKSTPKKNLAPSGTVLDFEWVANRSPAYNLNEVTIRGNQWYKSLLANNSSVPGVDLAKWLPLSQGNSGGWWKAGVYSDEKPVVLSDHNGSTEHYQLVDPTRPFISENIAVEETAGYWVSISGKSTLQMVDVSGDTAVLNMKGRDQMWFKAIQNLDHELYLQFTNDSNLLEFKLRIIILDTVPIHFPENTKSSDALYGLDKIWRPLDIGEYEFVATYDQENYIIKPYGPAHGGANSMPTVFDNVIALNASLLDGPLSYYDPEGDLENNPAPEATNIEVTGTGKPGNTLTLSWDFDSPMDYAQGTPIIQWYRSEIDNTNREAIPGETTTTYEVVDGDVGCLIDADLVVTQTAPPPANGNPNSITYISPGKIIEANEVIPSELDLALHYNHYLKRNTYDNVLKRAADMGLSGAGLFFTSPVGNEPTFEADGSLLFNPDVVQQWLDYNNISGGSSRTHEIVGVAVPTALGGIIRTLYAFGTSFDFRVTNSSIAQARFSGTEDFGTLVANTKYAFRIRYSSNGTLASIRLQLNYDPLTGTFEYDLTNELSNNGLGLGSNAGRIGANKSGTPGFGWKGKVAEFALRVGSHIDPANEVLLWARLNNVKDLTTV